MLTRRLPLLVILAVPITAGAKREVVDKIAAVIENDIITMRELEEKAAPYMDKARELDTPEAREKKRLEILRQVLDIEIGERIVTAEIERHKDTLGVTEADVDRAVQEVLRMNNITEEQLQAALYSQSTTWTEYRAKLRSQIERAKLIQFRVQGKVQIKDADVKRRCRERQKSGAKNPKLCASHILKRIPEGASPAAIEKLRTEMSQLQAELASGADFAAYALKESDDTSAPDGDIGCFGRGEMVEPFEKAVVKLEVGEVSPVVRTQFGFHIIKLTDRRFPAGKSCDDAKTLEPFRNEIYQEELDRQMNLWLAELRRKAFVEVRF